MEALNGKDIDGKTMFAGRAQKKAERESLLRSKFEEVRRHSCLASGQIKLNQIESGTDQIQITHLP